MKKIISVLTIIALLCCSSFINLIVCAEGTYDLLDGVDDSVFDELLKREVEIPEATPFIQIDILQGITEQSIEVVEAKEPDSVDDTISATEQTTIEQDIDEENDSSNEEDLWLNYSWKTDGVRVKITMNATDGAQIYYTTDSSEPTISSELYEKPIYVYEDTELKAIAAKGNITTQVFTQYISVDDTSDEEVDYDYEDSEEDNYEGDEDYYVNTESEYDSDYEEISLITSNWAENEMRQALEEGLIPDEMISDDLTKKITREQFAAVAVKLYLSLSDYEIFTEPDITDTPFIDCYYRDSRYIDYISFAYDLGLIKGISATEFAPYAEISRQDLAVMLARVIKKCKWSSWRIDFENNSDSILNLLYALDISGVDKFNDDEYISDYAKESVYYMVKNGIIYGVDNGLFAPQNITELQKSTGYATSTKEQALAISLRCYKNYPF